MITTKFRDPTLEEMRHTFNATISQAYPSILEWSVYELSQKTGNKYSPDEWRNFKRHEAVQAWYDEELRDLAQSKAFALMKQAGTNNSTATTQGLAQLLNFMDRNKEETKSNEIFVYSFVNLSSQEEKADNVTIIENIPTEISDAIIKIK